MPRQLIDQVPLPTVRPFFTQIILDHDGNLWVKLGPAADSDSPEDRYLIFDEHSTIRGSLRLPSLRVLEIGSDYVVGVREDEYGVEYLLEYDILKPVLE